MFGNSTNYTEKSFPSLEEALEYAKYQGYQRYNHNTTTKCEDKNARKAALKWKDTDYNPTAHNCV